MGDGVVIAAEKYNHLSNLAVAAALNPLQWQAFLDDMGQALGTRVCTQLMGFDQLSMSAPLAYSSGYDPDLLQLYETRYADKNPWAAQFGKHAVGEVVSTRQLVAPSEVKKTPFYADLILPMEDIGGGGGVILARDADRMFAFGGNIREKDRDRYEQDWLSLCKSLAPIVRQSLEINRTISGLSFEKWAAEQHRLGPGTAIMVVDPTMRIHFASEIAQNMLAEGTLIGSLFDRHLLFHADYIQHEFASFAQLHASGSQTLFRNWRLTDKHGRRWICRATGMRLADIDKTPFDVFLSEYPLALLIAIKPEHRSSSVEEQLQQGLRLSKAEAVVSVMLAGGRSAREIALERNVSVFTVRNQIKAALSKSGCRRQSELVGKIEQMRMNGGW